MVELKSGQLWRPMPSGNSNFAREVFDLQDDGKTIRYQNLSVTDGAFPLAETLQSCTRDEWDEWVLAFRVELVR